MAMGPGDTLWILDHRLERYSAFDSQGKVLKTYLRTVRGSYEWQSLGSLIVQEGRFLDWGMGETEMRGKRYDAYRPILLSSDFTPRDSFPQVDFPVTALEGGGPQVYFAPFLSIYATPDGTVWFAGGDEYKIHRRSLKGDTLLTVSLKASPAEITEADQQLIQSQGESPSSAARHLSGLSKGKPLIHGLFSDNAGHLFVFVQERGVPVGTALDVFEETGIYLGRLTLPHRVPFNALYTRTSAFATRTHIYVLGHSEADEPFVSRLKIVKGQ
jgi:hypothetical protein